MIEEQNKTDSQIISEQLDFFVTNKSGCAFAAVAAKNPTHYEWRHVVIANVHLTELETVISAAIDDASVSTLALIFPDVKTDQELDLLIPKLLSRYIVLHEHYDTERNRCFRFRAKIGNDESYISGFGPFSSMPVTRRSPHTAIVMRVKPRPDYDWDLKSPEKGIIHIADMDMKGMTDRQLRRLWNNSFLTTKGRLDKDPDDESAAKTTFVIPLDRADQIDI